MRAEGECQAFLAPAPEVHAAPGTEFEDFGTKKRKSQAMNQSTMQALAPLPAWPRRRRRRLQRTSRAATLATLHPSASSTRAGLDVSGAPIHKPCRSRLHFCRNHYVEGSGSLSTAETRYRSRHNPTAATARRQRRTAAATPGRAPPQGVGGRLPRLRPTARRRQSSWCWCRRRRRRRRRRTCRRRARLRDPFVSDTGR